MATFNRKREYTDLELQAFCRAGQDGAFTMLYDRHLPNLLRAIGHLHQFEGQSEEIAGDTMLKLHAEIAEKQKVINNIPGWLVRVATRCYINYLREDRRKQQVFLREFDEERLADATGESSEAERNKRLDVLFLNFNRLRVDHQEILALRYFHGLPPREIVKELQMPLKDVNSLLKAARKKLRDLHK